ncbi:iron-containing alcohol dehydrogenase, partial [Candidatus Aerophobetes bacterium]|nr:iron-containing alcohol dehydrogenase [Candidatus Aerophobetes bacterium]
LPHVLEYNLPFCREKAKKIAERLKIEREDNLPQMLKNLLIKIGLPLNFKNREIKEEDIPLLIEKSKGRSMSNNPRNLSDEELSQILRKVI